MKTHAYREMYNSRVQDVLGDAFDYAVNSCGISGNEFAELFAMSTISKRIANGEPAYVSGKSGIEITIDVIAETKGIELDIEQQINYSRSKEYWIGWIIAYYQCHSGRQFEDIFKALSYEKLEKMYYPLHEADISKFTEIADSKMKEYYPETNLRRIRNTYGLTQAELAEVSGVSLRSIQMYEQRNKNINKASAETIYALAKALGCPMENLIEK